MTAASDLLARTACGAGWVIAWRWATRLLGLASTLILVRLLPPAAFGLVALAAALVAALDASLSLGVEDGVVRAHRPDRALLDTAFTLNLLRGAAVGLAVALAAAPAAAFLGDARLDPILLALAASAVLGGAENVGTVEFRRRLDFRSEFRLLLAPRLLGIAVTVTAAAILRDHWALVLGIVANRAALVAATYVMHPYRPRLSLAAWRALAGVSAWTWALGLATLLRDRADLLAVGRALGPSAAGLHAAAVEIATLPATELADPLGRACMPGFAEAGRTGADAGAAFLRLIGATALIAVPAGMGLSLIAGPLVALAFGPAWHDAALVVGPVAAASAAAPLAGVSAALLLAEARLRALLLVTAAAAALRVALLLFLLPEMGLAGGGLALAVAMPVEAALLARLALSRLGIPTIELLAVVARPLFAAAMMVAVLVAAGLAWTEAAGAAEAIRTLVVAVPLGAASYLAALALLWRHAGTPAGAEADALLLLRRAAPGA